MFFSSRSQPASRLYITRTGSSAASLCEGIFPPTRRAATVGETGLARLF
jgi:hypothetical protein